MLELYKLYKGCFAIYFAWKLAIKIIHNVYKKEYKKSVYNLIENTIDYAVVSYIGKAIFEEVGILL